MDQLQEKIISQLQKIPGKVSFYYKELTGDGALSFRAGESLMAASVIKLPILAAVFQAFEDGVLSPGQSYTLREEDKKPSCGCLNRLHAGLPLTVTDLCNLMIILSDNTATNILIGLLGMEKINAWMDEQGFSDCRLNRLLFDEEASKRGIQNYVSAKSAGTMLERLYRGTLVSGPADEQMLAILKEQRLNGKIPFRFEEKLPIAHKTGEDSGITHDVGIVYGRHPFIVCFMGNEVKVPEFERFMQDTAFELFERLNG